MSWLVCAAGPGDGPEEWRSLLEARLGPGLVDLICREGHEPLRVRVVYDGERLALLSRQRPTS